MYCEIFTMSVGKLETFDEETMDFSTYSELLHHFMLANGVVATRKVSVLISVIGRKTYQILKDLLDPVEISTKSYDELIQVLSTHFSPKKIVISERYKFYKRNQEQGETVSQYVVAIKHLAATCDFKTFLNDALRDRFVSGIISTRIQKKLLEQEEMSFEDAVRIAQNVEVAEKEASLLQGPVNNTTRIEVNTVRKSAPVKINTSSGSGVHQQHNQLRCYRCGGPHPANTCPYVGYQCRKCSKKGHLAKVCRNKSIQQVTVEDTSTPQCDSECEMYTVYNRSKNDNETCKITIVVENQPLEMIVDTGAACSVISENTYNQCFSHLPCTSCKYKLKTYSGEDLVVKGELEVKIKYNNQVLKLPLIVVKGYSQNYMPPLLGRNWMKKLQINWSTLFSLTTEHVKESLIRKYPNVFQTGIKPIRDIKADIVLKNNVVPVFCKARPVPYALLESVEQELNKLEKENVIRKVKYSNWATPLVVVPKAKDASGTQGVRLCGDFKMTLNKWVETEHYPLPNSEDLFSSLAGGKVFTVLDLCRAYHQLEVNVESQEYLTINTHRGLYRYNRLPYGVCSAPAIFQSVMDRVLLGLKGVTCYLDDLLIVGASVEDCYNKVDQVLNRLVEYNLTLNVEKCKFFEKSVEYLGYRIDSEGIHPTSELTEAIVNAPEPQNKQELKSYLGLITFYAKFLPNLSTLLEPLYRLLHNDNIWDWTLSCKQVFTASKDLLIRHPVLVHYDSSKPLILACDASPYGIGAVISHVMDNGSERPIAFASRTLSKQERKYPQLEREALSIIFGVKKFSKFLYGRHFVLLTDHKPLVKILNVDSQVPTLAAARLQRWALTLSAYRYDIAYRQGVHHTNVDALSRLPVQGSELEGKVMEYPVLFFAYLKNIPLTFKDIQKETMKDKILSKVVNLTLGGWPEKVDNEELKPYFTRRFELTIEQDCVVWGQRVIVPPVLRNNVLSLLHEQHPGMTRMKMLARSYVWWPNMDSDIEQKVRTCENCQRVQSSMPRVPLHPWPLTERKWQRIHIDFAKQDAHTYFIIIDSYSKWIEVFFMNSTTAEKTIAKLRTLFASYGLPEEVVSDNGPPYQSQEMKDFFIKNGIKFLNIPPGHAPSNGAAERAVATVKLSLLKQMCLDKIANGSRTMQHHLDNFLFAYRNTPTTATGKTPAELFLGRTPRTRLTLLKPKFTEGLKEKQESVKRFADQHRGEMRQFQKGDRVLVRSIRDEVIMWWPGVVHEVISPVTYKVLVRGQLRFVHADHLKCYKVLHASNKNGVPTEVAATNTTDNLHEGPKEEIVLRRSHRVRRPPDRLVYH